MKGFDLMIFKDLLDLNSKYEITSLSTDSRDVKRNSVFFCIEGYSKDRHDFVDEAVAKGALAIVHSKDIPNKDEDTFYFQVDDVYAALEEAVDYYFNKPSERLKLIGVTGTNGKTTITSAIHYFLDDIGESSGYIGTLGVEYNETVLENSLTTPDIIHVNHYLDMMGEDGVITASLEVSSQGLDMKRVDKLDFDVIGFTNLSMEHLDYHGTMENYYQAKKHLFDILKEEGKMVINIDDEYGQRLYDEVDHPHKYSISLHKDADYRAVDVEVKDEYSTYTILHKGKSYPVKTNLLGEFNVYNTLQMLALLDQAGYYISVMSPLIDNLPDIKGRMNFVEEDQDFKVVVDYSHTPDGYEKIFTYLKSITPGRLISVIGSAGGRDHEKRPYLGKVSAKYCDEIVVTEEDPRDESVFEIAEEIMKDVPEVPYHFFENREDGIEFAINVAEKGDTVVILGKGVEKFQPGPLGNEPWPGDDQVAIDAIKRKNNQ